MPPAARITDNVAHPLPPVLTPGPGSLNVLIGFLPAWRAIPTGAAAALQAAKQVADTAIQTAQAATAAAAGTPGAPAAKIAEEATKTAMLAQMSSTITGAAMGADIHMCTTPLPVPPHGPGVVIDGSPTVLINNLPASRLGDTILEAIGPPNKIVRGEVTVIIGQSGSGSFSPGSSSAGAPATTTPPDTSGEAKFNQGGGSMSGPQKPPSQNFGDAGLPPLGPPPKLGNNSFAQSMSKAKETCAPFG